MKFTRNFDLHITVPSPNLAFLCRNLDYKPYSIILSRLVTLSYSYLLTTIIIIEVYVDELSKKLSAAKTGCIINDISIIHVFYADDLCIMSAAPSGLQKLIDICFEYSLHNSLTFNSTKSVCIVFKPKRFKLHCPTMTLNSVPMEYVTDVKYLGFMFTSDSKDDVDMQKQLRTFYARSNTILRQFGAF